MRLKLSIPIGLLLAYHPLAWSYTHTLTQQGQLIRWRAPMELSWVGNSHGKSSIQSQDLFKASVNGLHQLQLASHHQFTWEYWQGTHGDEYPCSGALDGYSTLYFSSTTPQGGNLDPNVLGLTQLWYDTRTGEILEADIELNDRDYDFTHSPEDTSGLGAQKPRYHHKKIQVYLQNVVTHELGHALGLAHSGHLQASMLYTESPEQAHLSCDDQFGIQSLYPTQNHEGVGQISGRVVSPDGKPLLGAQVILISGSHGTSIASLMTNSNGEYESSIIPEGYYFLMVEPFLSAPQSLPSYYSHLSSRICPNQTHFQRTFLKKELSRELTPIQIQSQRKTQAPEIRVHCPEQENTSIFSSPDSPVEEQDLPIFLIDSPSQVARMEYFRGPSPQRYLIRSSAGIIQANGIAYSLYSPIHLSMRLFDSEGRRVDTLTRDPIFLGDSGWINYDSELLTHELASGEYWLEVSAEKLGQESYPAGDLSLDSQPFFILSLTKRDLSQTSSNHPRCLLPNLSTHYISPSGSPKKMHLNSQALNLGFCSSQTNHSGNFLSVKSLLLATSWLSPILLVQFLFWFLNFLHGRAHAVKLRV